MIVLKDKTYQVDLYGLPSDVQIDIPRYFENKARKSIIIFFSLKVAVCRKQ